MKTKAVVQTVGRMSRAKINAKINKSNKAHRCKSIRFRNRGRNSFVYYKKPVSKSDFKRYGKYLEIESEGWKIKLNGAQINSIKNALRAVGEIGGRVNKKKCDIW